jgi:flagellar biosynthesis/type III secretory pathway protein FliH
MENSMSRKSKDQAIQQLVEQYEEWLNEDNDSITSEWQRFFGGELTLVEDQTKETRTAGYSEGQSEGSSDSRGESFTRSRNRNWGGDLKESP